MQGCKQGICTLFVRRPLPQNTNPWIERKKRKVETEDDKKGTSKGKREPANKKALYLVLKPDGSAPSNTGSARLFHRDIGTKSYAVLRGALHRVYGNGNALPLRSSVMVWHRCCNAAKLAR